MISDLERIAELNEFMTFVQETWPKMRESVLAHQARRCALCLNSEKYVPLTQGVCAECCPGGVTAVEWDNSIKRENDNPRPGGLSSPYEQQDSDTSRHNSQSVIGEEIVGGNESVACHRLILSSCGQGVSYDALLLFSGGKDSVYLLDRLSTTYPDLRMLAVMIDNGFASPVALQNTRRVFAKYDVDHFVFTPHHSLYRSAFRHALTLPAITNGYPTVDLMDGDLTFDICRNIAASLSIPLMIAGLSPEQVERILRLKSFESPEEVESIRREYSGDCELDAAFSPRERAYWWDPGRYGGSKIPRVLFPFHAWGYSERDVREYVVSRELLPPGNDNPLVTNNELIPVIMLRDYCSIGYCGFEPEFASLVRSGKADRLFWLHLFEAAEYLSMSQSFVPNCIGSTLNKLELSLADLIGEERQLKRIADQKFPGMLEMPACTAG